MDDDLTAQDEFDDIVVGVITINCMGLPFVELKNRRALDTLNNWGMFTQPLAYDGNVAYCHIDRKVVAAAEGGIVGVEAQECRTDGDVDVLVVGTDGESEGGIECLERRQVIGV